MQNSNSRSLQKYKFEVKMIFLAFVMNFQTFFGIKTAKIIWGYKYPAYTFIDTVNNNKIFIKSFRNLSRKSSFHSDHQFVDDKQCSYSIWCGRIFHMQELLDLGETVGTQSRGLSQENISLLPISKCVICQMEYKRGDQQINLPCKHIYHSGCGSRWLSINKACPICYKEVFANASKQSAK
ncbi:hypothetical protein DCAR_0728184 [Daucus carota subsp. sativus]|uniref:RING-type domain-containing protein n=1 Tax=Daucus carota subsp. sativus TaxID=79200 RepID=A0AAF1B9C4_DAUCS|nr:hypothetical protein DCAR_0728184 [Daucus carota subsp. sativus]